MSPPASPTPDKLKFKDKIKNIIVEAEIAQAKALREEQTQDARSLATDLLVQGYPSAFCGKVLLRHRESIHHYTVAAPNIEP
jgi:hypothetical protein